jgi:ATP-binding cassette subfamily B protein RaxB
MIGLELGWRRRTPLVLQSEVAECGLACLAMVAARHGLVLDLRTLRERVGASPRGVTLAMLATMAERLGLRSRAVRLEPSELGALRLPAILHWEMRHFVVLDGVNREGVEILDPGRGARRVMPKELDRAFTGVALELEPSLEFRSEDAARRLAVPDLFRGVPDLGRVLISLFALSLAIQVLALIMPLATQLVIDEVLVAADRSLLDAVMVGAALLIATQTALTVARALAVQSLATRLGRSLHIGLFDHMVALPIGYFAQRSSGDIASRFGSLDAIQRTLTTSFLEAVIDGLLGVIAFAMLCLYSTTLAAVACAALLVYLALRAAWYGPLKRALDEQIHHGARRQSHLLETLRAVPTLRVYGAEGGRVAHQDDLNCNALNAGIRAGHLGILARTANAAIFGVEGLAVLYLGAQAVLDGQMTLGMLMAAMSFKATFTGRVSGLVDRWIEFRMLELHAERVAGIALEEPLPRRDHAAFTAAGAATVELDGLGFRHPHGRWLFRGIDLAVAPGRCLAVVGPSGCGKTSLAKLILGLLAPVEGMVRIDGQAVEPVCRGAPRCAVTAVLQDDALLAGSIADNIAFGVDAPDLGRVEAVARAAAIHDEIMTLPTRYDTLIGEMGSALSGGQRQRILLARALYFEPRLLVLDEATSHLDAAGERSVVDQLRVMPMTRIVIAHRAETIRLADEVLDLGALVRAPSKGFGMQA